MDLLFACLNVPRIDVGGLECCEEKLTGRGVVGMSSGEDYRYLPICQEGQHLGALMVGGIVKHQYMGLTPARPWLV